MLQVCGLLGGHNLNRNHPLRSNHSSNALDSLHVLLEVSLGHEVLHLHAASTLGKNDASIFLLHLKIGQVHSRVISDGVPNQWILIPCFSRALVVVLRLRSHLNLI